MMSTPEFDRVGFHIDLQVDDETVFEVLIATGHLQVTSVVQQCCDYLQTQFVQLRFDVQTYCHVSAIADRHGLKTFKKPRRLIKMAYIYKVICEMKTSCPMLMLISTLAFSAEMTSVLLQRHSSSNP